MNRIRRLALVLAGVLLLGLIPAQNGQAADVNIDVSNVQVIELPAGSTYPFRINIKNTGTAPLTNVTVTPQIAGKDIPFGIIQNSPDGAVILQPGQAIDFTYSFTAGPELPGGNYDFRFTVNSDQGEQGYRTVFVKTIAAPQQSEDPGVQAASYGDDGIVNNEPMSFGGGEASGGGGESNSSVPRIIVTGFSTDPGEVKAGSNFNLIIHLQNTSKKTVVSNLLFDLTAPTEGAEAGTAGPAFLPSSGSNSIYLEKIPAGGAVDISMNLNARNDLLQKPYSMELSMKYEDGNATEYTSASTVSIPVKQEARVEFSDIEVTPESISVDQEANVMCSLYNLGRTKLYNVKVKFEGAGISSKNQFVGNVESGATASIDGMLKAEKPSAEPVPVKMIVTYEDEAGAMSTIEQEFSIEILDGEEMMDDPMEMDGMIVDESGGLPILPMIIGAAVIAAAIIIVVIVRKKKKQKEEGDELNDELDRLMEDE